MCVLAGLEFRHRGAEAQAAGGHPGKALHQHHTGMDRKSQRKFPTVSQWPFVVRRKKVLIIIRLGIKTVFPQFSVAMIIFCQRQLSARFFKQVSWDQETLRPSAVRG